MAQHENRAACLVCFADDSPVCEMHGFRDYCRDCMAGMVRSLQPPFTCGLCPRRVTVEDVRRHLGQADLERFRQAVEESEQPMSDAEKAANAALALPPGYGRCPGCKEPVEKTSGCNHMQHPCRAFRLEVVHFCMLCTEFLNGARPDYDASGALHFPNGRFGDCINRQSQRRSFRYDLPLPPQHHRNPDRQQLQQQDDAYADEQRHRQHLINARNEFFQARASVPALQQALFFPLTYMLMQVLSVLPFLAPFLLLQSMIYSPVLFLLLVALCLLSLNYASQNILFLIVNMLMFVSWDAISFYLKYSLGCVLGFLVNPIDLMLMVPLLYWKWFRALLAVNCCFLCRADLFRLAAVICRLHQPLVERCEPPFLRPFAGFALRATVTYREIAQIATTAAEGDD
jgi:hypothetical protein